jgi:hypothetical protein
MRAGVVGDRHQVGPFGIEPGSGRRGAGKRRRGGGGRRDPGPAVELGGKQGVHGRRCDIEVIVEQPSPRGAALVFAVMAGSQLASVGPQQIVHAETSRCGGVDKVRVGQHAEYPAGVLNRGMRCRRDGVAVKVRPGMQAGQPERAGGIGAELLVRPGELRPHPGVGIPIDVELV